MAQFPIEKSFNNFRQHLQPRGQITSGRTNAESEHSMVERCKALQKQRRVVEKNMQNNDGTSLQRFLLWMRKLVVDSNGDGPDQRLGD